MPYHLIHSRSMHQATVRAGGEWHLFFKQGFQTGIPVSMLRLFTPSVSCSDTILTRIKSKRVPYLFVIPLCLYLVFRAFETELTNFIIPLFPDEPDKSFGFYRDFLRLCFNEMLWLSLFLLTAWVIIMYVPLRDVMTRIEDHFMARPVVYTAGIAGLSLVAIVFVALYILDEFPNSADEYVYLYQAEALNHGLLTQSSHPLDDFFRFNHVIQKDGVRTGRFPPGWPLFLAIPFSLGVPPVWLNPVLGIITLLVFYAFVKNYYSQRVAFWSVISFAFTAYFIFHSASYFSHTACLLFTVSFIYSLHVYAEKQSGAYALLAGIFLGLIVITRYYNAVLIFVPVLIWLLYFYRWKAFRPLSLIGVGCLPFFGMLAWYNYQITGDPFLPVTTWADHTETLGFVKGHTPLKGIEHFIRRILLFFYWSSPALLLLYFVFLFQKVRHKAQRYTHPEDYYMLLLFIGYFFYHHLGGNQYGPRFLFEAYPFVIVFVINQAFRQRSKWPFALLAAGMLYAIVKLPYIMEREHRVVRERLDLYARVEEANISNAVILISTHTSVIRPMPVSDLTRNGIDYNGHVIYAHDLGSENAKILEFYPERSFYKYIRDPDKVKGQVVKLR